MPDIAQRTGIVLGEGEAECFHAQPAPNARLALYLPLPTLGDFLKPLTASLFTFYFLDGWQERLHESSRPSASQLDWHSERLQ